MGQQDVARLGQERPAPRADRVVERDDEVARGSSAQAFDDLGPRRQQVRERDRAEVVAERGAGAGSRCLQRADAWRADHFDPGCGRAHALFAPVEQFEDQRGHGIDACIPRADERHVAPFARAFERVAAAILLAAERKVRARLAGGERPQKVDIEAVAHKLLGLLHEARNLGRAPGGLARADPHDREPPARPAAQFDERCGGQCERAGGVGALAFGVPELPRRAGLGKCRGLGHAMGADLGKDSGGRRCKPWRLGLERGGGKEPQRYVEVAGKREDRGLVGLEINGTDRMDRGRCDPCLGQHRADKRGEFGRRAVA